MQDPSPKKKKSSIPFSDAIQRSWSKCFRFHSFMFSLPHIQSKMTFQSVLFQELVRNSQRNSSIIFTVIFGVSKKSRELQLYRGSWMCCRRKLSHKYLDKGNKQETRRELSTCHLPYLTVDQIQQLIMV